MIDNDSIVSRDVSDQIKILYFVNKDCLYLSFYMSIIIRRMNCIE
jgi:hypothetical protein